MVYYNIAFLIALFLSMAYVMHYQKHFDVCITAIFLLIPISNLGYIIRATSETLSQAMLANSIIYMGGCFLPFFLTFSILSLCDIKVKPFMRTVILSVNSLLFFFILTTDTNHLFYKTVRFNKHNGIGVLTKTYGPLHTVYYVLITLYLLAGLITIIYSFFRRQHVSRIMLFMLVLPELFTVMGFFGGKGHGLTK